MPNVYSHSWERSGLAEHPDEAWHDQYRFLEFQLRSISESPRLLRIRRFHEVSPLWGHATVGVVQCRVKDGGGATYQGDFEIELNAAKMAPAEDHRHRDLEVWAVVIAHEMLHNLGHSHGDRSRLYQMILFEQCMYHDGEYVPGQGCPEFDCGLRKA